MISSDLDNNKQYMATYEFVHFADRPIGADRKTTPVQDRKVFTVEKCYTGYPNDITLSVKYYMGHYGAIQGKLIGEINEITNTKT